MALKVTDDNFQEEVLNSDKPVLVDFWAEWCMPCLMLTPIIDELHKEYEGKIKVGKLNVDENRATASQYGVMSIPTVKLFKDGKIVKEFIGVQPKQVYEQAIKEVLGD